MRLCKFILVLTLASSLQGCWFIYVPGNVVGAVSDAFTGAEGSNCVGPNAKVGDKVRLPGGGIGTIKSLSGTSSRCKNPELPIRALLVVETLSQVPTASSSKLGLNLPTGWEQKSLTDQMKANGVLLYATNRTIDAGTFLSATKREGITDLMEYATSREASQASRLADPQKSQVSQIQINGKKAFRFDVTGSVKSGQKLTYMMTIIEGETEIAVVNTWTTAANFERRQEVMSTLAQSVTGL
jgi:hypothetical protein